MIFVIFLIIPSSKSQLPLNTLHLLMPSSLSASQISGKIPIDSENYQVICDCNNLEKPLPSIQCNPSKIKLSEDKSGQGISYRELSEILGNHDFSYTRAKNQPFRCLDGRDSEAGIFTPGGDAGEFILALIVYEDASGSVLEFESVRSFFEEWLKSMQSAVFFMCTDEDSVLHLGKQVGADLNINKPRPELVNDLLKHVSEIRNVGDSHLRLMLEYPQLYSIRPEIVKHFIKAFYSILWEKNNFINKLLQLNVLSGEHREKAYVEVRSSEECIYEGVSPLFNSETSLYLNFIDAVNVRRRDLAEFFAVKIAKNKDGINPDKLFKRMNHHGLLFLDTTGSYIAKSLPFYTALFI